MKIINDQMLSIPPYFSASWEQITALQMIEKNQLEHLKVTLQNKEVMEIPNLTKEEIKQIFEAHQQYLSTGKKQSSNPFDLLGSMKLDSFGDINKLSMMMQHDLSQSSSEDLPAEMLEKFKQFSAQILPLMNGLEVPKAEPHCNCPHCQVMRVLNTNEPQSEGEEKRRARN